MFPPFSANLAIAFNSSSLYFCGVNPCESLVVLCGSDSINNDAPSKVLSVIGSLLTTDLIPF